MGVSVLLGLLDFKTADSEGTALLVWRYASSNSKAHTLLTA